MYEPKIQSSTVAALAGVSLFALSAAASNAAILASDSFNYALGSIATLNGGTGFSGAYTGAGSVTAPGQTFSGITAAGNTFTTNGSDQGAFRNFTTPIGTDSGTIFVRFLGSNTTLGAPNYAGFSFFTGGSEELFLGKTFNATNYGFETTGVNNSARTGPGATISATSSLLVYRLTFGPTTDTIDFFYNPGSTLGTPDATFTTADNAPFPATLTGIRLQSGNNADTFDFDEIVIATTAAEVLPIPEPSALGLISVAAAGLVLRRRRA